MTHKEKEQLLSMFLAPSNWCKEMEACDSSGSSVAYDDPSAVAWDLTGGLCRLFGWDRAGELFPQLVRYMLNTATLTRRPSTAIQAMVALQNYNDHSATTHDLFLAQLQKIPVWARGERELSPASTENDVAQGDADV